MDERPSWHSISLVLIPICTCVVLLASESDVPPAVDEQRLAAIKSDLDQGNDRTKLKALFRIERMRLDGFPIKEAIINCLKSKDDAVCYYAEEVLSQIGVRLIPSMLTELDSPDLERQTTVLRILSNMIDLNQDTPTVSSLRTKVSELWLLEDERGSLAIKTIARMGLQSKPIIDRALESSDWRVTQAGLTAISQMDRASSREFLSKVESFLEDKSDSHRRSAAETIGEVGQCTPGGRKLLLSMLGSEETRSAASNALVGVGESALDDLLDLAADEHATLQTRVASLYIVERIGRPARGHLEKLSRLLKSRASKIREIVRDVIFGLLSFSEDMDYLLSLKDEQITDVKSDEVATTRIPENYKGLFSPRGTKVEDLFRVISQAQSVYIKILALEALKSKGRETSEYAVKLRDLLPSANANLAQSIEDTIKELEPPNKR